MQKITQRQQETKMARQPNKTVRVINNRSVNPAIFSLFLQKRFKQCSSIINRCQSDEFKLYMSALIERQQFKLQKSLSLISECQVMNKLNFTYLKCIAKNFFLLGKYKSSLEVAKDAYKLNSNEHEIFYIFGKISLALNDQANAINNFNLSIAKNPNEESYIEIAKLQIINKQYKQAIETLKNALTVSEENPELFEMLGEVYIETGQRQEALSLFKSALEKDNYRYNCLLGIANMAIKDNSDATALENFTKAHEISPNSAVLWNNIGIYMFNKKKFIAAYSCFKRALFLDPFRWDIHANLAILLMNNKKYLSAHINLRSAIQIKSDAFLFNLLGVCLSELGDHANSIKAFEQSLYMEDNNETSYNFIICLIKAGEKTLAKSNYEKLIKVANQSLQKRLNQLKRQF